MKLLWGGEKKRQKRLEELELSGGLTPAVPCSGGLGLPDQHRVCVPAEAGADHRSPVSGLRAGSILCAQLGSPRGCATVSICPRHRQCLRPLWRGKSKDPQCSPGCRRIYLMFSLFSTLFSSGKTGLQGDEHLEQHQAGLRPRCSFQSPALPGVSRTPLFLQPLAQQQVLFEMRAKRIPVWFGLKKGP